MSDKLQEIKKQLDEVLTDELGFDGVDGTYVYFLTRDKEAFHVGTMTLDDFVEVDGDFTYQLIERVMTVVSPLMSQLEQAQAENERLKADKQKLVEMVEYYSSRYIKY